MGLKFQLKNHQCLLTNLTEPNHLLQNLKMTLPFLNYRFIRIQKTGIHFEKGVNFSNQNHLNRYFSFNVPLKMLQNIIGVKQEKNFFIEISIDLNAK